jgi:CRISPR-associated DxTHG motif protein
MAKLIISFLGTGNYETGQYGFSPEQKHTSRFVQTALASLLQPDRVIVMVTEEAGAKNWEGMDGLAASAARECPNMVFQQKLIPGGKTEDEFWRIFEALVATVGPEDEVIFDVTHSFRSIPLIAIASLQYIRVLYPAVRVSGVYYGAWEAREASCEPPFAPLLDLTSFITLMDWSKAVSDYQGFGNVTALKKLLDAEALPRKKATRGKDEEAQLLHRLGQTLQTVSANIATCRGMEIASRRPWDDVRELITDLKQGPNTVAALSPLLDRIQAKVDQLQGPDAILSDDIRRGFGAVQWCLEHDLIQQAYTLLQETIVTWVCQQAGLNQQERGDRSFAAMALGLWKIPEEKWRDEARTRPDEVRYILRSIPRELLQLYDPLKTLRNDLNHAGTVECYDAKKVLARIHEISGQMQRIFTQATSVPMSS